MIANMKNQHSIRRLNKVKFVIMFDIITFTDRDVGYPFPRQAVIY
jgi:hypothetical protein